MSCPVWVLGTKLGLSRSTVCVKLLSRSAPLCFCFSSSPFYKLPSKLNCSYVSYKDIAMVCFHCITIPLWSRGLNLSVVQAVFALLSSQASCALWFCFFCCKDVVLNCRQFSVFNPTSLTWQCLETFFVSTAEWLEFFGIPCTGLGMPPSS